CRRLHQPVWSVHEGSCNDDGKSGQIKKTLGRCPVALLAVPTDQHKVLAARNPAKGIGQASSLREDGFAAALFLAVLISPDPHLHQTNV
ncbi:MAG: hypothetical protein ACI4TP_06920, partial [Anaerotignum sp.]